MIVTILKLFFQNTPEIKDNQLESADGDHISSTGNIKHLPSQFEYEPKQLGFPDETLLIVSYDR